MKLEDVARLANVSKSAVSLAINGKPGVSAETRDHILNIVEEYNYVPLRTIRKPTKKNATIRLIACKSPNIITDHYQNLPFFYELISNLSSSINEYPYELIISTFNEETILEELQEAEKEQQAEGNILLGTNLNKEKIKMVHNQCENLVILDTHFPGIDANFVSINNFLGGYTAADYLIKQGHKKISYVQGIPRIANFEERKNGFFSRLKESSLNILDHYTLELPAMDIKEAIEIKDFFEQLKEYPTAIFCENDYMAISLMKLLKNLNIDVPEEVSVIGFDDIRESRVISPELTTLQVDKKEMAIQTLKLLNNQINNNHNINKHIQVNTAIVDRKSSTSITLTPLSS